MPSRQQSKPTEIVFYEGLIRKTASIYAPYVDEDFEDIVAIFRVKVWRALQAFDPARSSMPVERYVFSCVKNRAKDLLRRRKRSEVYIDDARASRVNREEAAVFNAEPDFLGAVSHDDVFGAVENERPSLPATLTQRERAVLALLYLEFSQRESAERLGLTRGEMERAVRSIRSKMSDWRPMAAAA